MCKGFSPLRSLVLLQFRHHHPRNQLPGPYPAYLKLALLHPRPISLIAQAPLVNLLEAGAFIAVQPRHLRKEHWRWHHIVHLVPHMRPLFWRRQ